MSVTSYAYNQDYWPPMPAVQILASRPGHEDGFATLPALVNSGSDGTIMPINVLEQIGARHVSNARVRGLFGESQVMLVYIVTLRIGSQVAHGTRVIGGAEGTETILGRNVLNQFIVTLNGPAGVIDISQ